MQRPDITGEKGLRGDDATTLLRSFRQEYPMEYDQWLDFETSRSGISQIGNVVRKFVKDNCDYNTATDITKAVLSLRGAVNQFIRTQGEGQ